MQPEIHLPCSLDPIVAFLKCIWIMWTTQNSKCSTCDAFHLIRSHMVWSPDPRIILTHLYYSSVTKTSRPLTLTPPKITKSHCRDYVMVHVPKVFRCYRSRLYTERSILSDVQPTTVAHWNLLVQHAMGLSASAMVILWVHNHLESVILTMTLITAKCVLWLKDQYSNQNYYQQFWFVTLKYTTQKQLRGLSFF